MSINVVNPTPRGLAVTENNQQEEHEKIEENKFRQYMKIFTL